MSEKPAIGGYFGLSIGTGTGLPWIADCVAVQSGRAALALALPARPATLWIPAYFCQPVAAALAATGWALATYAIDEHWAPRAEVTPGPQDRVLLVDFFGLSAGAVAAGVARFGAERCIVDASMALFAPPTAGVPTAYSPRKFAGLPDGGLLVGRFVSERLAEADEGASALRSRHLLLRAAGDLQGGRQAFAEAEASLDDDTAPRRMSHLTATLFAAIDFERAGAMRRHNYDRLAAGLRARGREVRPRPLDAVPLCCPVLGANPGIWRPQLAEAGIFCPAYWPALDIHSADIEGRRLAANTTFLPCDQRYGDADIDLILHAIDTLEAHP